MYYKILYEELKENLYQKYREWVFSLNGKPLEFEKWLRNMGFQSEDGNREVSHHFDLQNRELGFRDYNFRAFPWKKADGTPAIYIGGAYMEFHRVHREIDISFEPNTARSIGLHLIELADQVESGNVTMKTYQIKPIKQGELFQP